MSDSTGPNDLTPDTGTTGEPDPDEPIRFLSTGDPDWPLRREVLERARSSSHPVVREALLDRLNIDMAEEPRWRAFVAASLTDRDYSVRKSAAAAAARLRLTEVVPQLLELLRDREELVRVEAVESLEYLWAAEAAAEIERLMVSDRSWLVRGYAARALATLAPDRSAALIARLGEERSPWVRAGLMLALCALGHTEWTSRALDRLRSRNYLIRCKIANNIEFVLTPANRDLVRQHLAAALERETTVAAREALAGALARVEQCDGAKPG